MKVGGHRSTGDVQVVTMVRGQHMMVGGHRSTTGDIQVVTIALLPHSVSCCRDGYMTLSEVNI